ncbi:MAG: metallophosphoesterase [Rhizobiaceae bacterium]|nr:metallophosphoesterase [Rhizobiaceae bacterium]MCV0407787.1 metallophosphoesterase [Rhizobiaceae bacterium]
MFRLAHLSDVHLGPLPDVTYRELASKRITGWVNWQRNRKQHMHDGVVDALMDDIEAQDPDHTVITGDLVNLALDAEIQLAHLWLVEMGRPDRLTVVPGNHDAYVPGALAKACKAWGDYMAGDGMTAPDGRHGFPTFRRRGSVAIIGVSSARSSAPFMASGYFREKQARRLREMLDAARRDGLFRVVLIHHPPVHGAAAAHKRLFGISRFQRVIVAHGAELVLHGHTHVPTLHWIAGPKGAAVPVVGVSAAGQGISGSKPPASFNLFEIDGEPGNWSVELIRRGLGRSGDGISEISRSNLVVARTLAIVQPVPD